MDYTIHKDRIIIENPEYFRARDILTCGQVFRYKQTLDGWEVRSGAKLARIIEVNGKVEIITSDPQYFANYFDFNTDYRKIIKDIIQKFLSKIEGCPRNEGGECDKTPSATIIQKSCEYGKGIRILKGELEEIIFSFIISANNNIKRIQGIIERLCARYGEPAEGGYAFPSAERLAEAEEGELKSLGLGYRAPYIIKTAKILLNGNAATIPTLHTLCSTSEARKELLKLPGVGPKVADCILLFGLGRTDVFPVDTWIERVAREDFSIDTANKEDARKYFLELFGNFAGYAQQYLFYYKRNAIQY